MSKLETVGGGALSGEYAFIKARDQVNFVDVDGNDILQRRC